MSLAWHKAQQAVCAELIATATVEENTTPVQTYHGLDLRWHYWMPPCDWPLDAMRSRAAQQAARRHRQHERRASQGGKAHELAELLGDDKDEERLGPEARVVGHPAAEEDGRALLCDDAPRHLQRSGGAWRQDAAAAQRPRP